MVRFVFRHFAADERFARRYRNEPSPEILLTLPFSGIFRGFSACSHKHALNQTTLKKNTENPEEKREMRVVW